MAQERCSGTLCDLYYGGPPPAEPADKPKTAPRPLTVPTLSVPGTGMLGRMFGAPADTPPPAGGAAPAPARPFVGIGGGGIAAMARGTAPERCTGTLCDLYYGGPPPEKPEVPGTDGRAAAPATEAAAVDPGADTEPDPAPQPRRRMREPVEAAPPRCAAAMGRDPWSCYR